MGTILARLKEPSTFAGLAGVALAVGQAWPPANHVTAVVAGVLAYLATHMADPGSPKSGAVTSTVEVTK